MLGNLGNLASMLKNAPEMLRKAQEIQGQAAEIRQKLAALRVEGSAGAGLVKVEASGDQRVIGVTIAPSLISDGDVEVLEELVTAATNQALEKARAAGAEMMGSLAGQMQLPGLNEMMEKLGLGGQLPN